MTFFSLSLCAGIGGIDLGLLPWCRPSGFVEIDPFCQRLLARRFPGVPIHGDIHTFGGTTWRGLVTLLVAGFPCQPFSTASRGRKVAENLWPEVNRVVRELEPPIVFLENVQREPIVAAARDLHARGYRGAVARVSSAQVGAPHDRRRWWLLAHAHDAQQSVLALDAEVAGVSPAPRAWDEIPGGLLGVDDGLPGRVDRLHALGNAVVPACAEAAFRVLVKALQ